MSTHKETESLQTHCGAEFFVQMLDRYGFGSGQEGELAAPQTLVVGSGTGHEAAYLHRELGGRVEAIDVEIEPNPQFRNVPGLNFQQASVLELPFEDRSFDAVFYHHVIEHVSDPLGSVVEIDRVARDRGWVFVGTPNRHRIVSSVGAHKQASWEPTIGNKLNDNLKDWRARLSGRFRNELGAHAGFSKRELDRLLLRFFSTRHWLTRDYLGFKYSDHPLRGAVGLAATHPVRWFLAPSIYVMCRR